VINNGEVGSTAYLIIYKKSGSGVGCLTCFDLGLTF
jgi:hypothetical protein